MEELDSLDSIFKEAKRHIRTETERRAKLPKGKPEPSTLYSDLDNYNRGKNVAIVNGTTLLGVFSEWVHKTAPDVRRLIRDESGLPIHEVEYVEGDWGTQIHTREPSQRLPVVQMELYLTLEAPRVTVYTRVAVTLENEGVLHVKLLSPVTFGAADNLLQLSPGLDILRVLSKQSKLDIRKELELCQSK